jgi:hypothetical protein
MEVERIRGGKSLNQLVDRLKKKKAGDYRVTGFTHSYKILRPPLLLRSAAGRYFFAD